MDRYSFYYVVVFRHFMFLYPTQAYEHSFFLLVIALCPNTEEVHIYKSAADKWEKVHVLQKVR